MLRSGSSWRIATPSLASLHVRLAGSGGLALLALIAANAIWGGSPAASKAAMGELGPFTVGAGRAGIALAFLIALLALRHERPASGRLPALLGLCGIALFCAFQNLGLVFADATTSTIISGARPVLIAALAVPLLGERMTGWRLVGLLLSVVGIGGIALAGAERAPTATLGALLPLASAVAIALYAVLCRRAGSGNSLATIAGATFYGFLFLLPGALLELVTTGVPAPTGRDVVVMLYLGLGCSAASFLLLGYAVSHLDVGRLAAGFNIQVLAGVALSVTMLDEELTPARIGGALTVLGGVAIAARQPARRADPAAARAGRSWRRYARREVCPMLPDRPITTQGANRLRGSAIPADPTASCSSPRSCSAVRAKRSTPRINNSTTRFPRARNSSDANAKNCPKRIDTRIDAENNRRARRLALRRSHTTPQSASTPPTMAAIVAPHSEKERPSPILNEPVPTPTASVTRT